MLVGETLLSIFDSYASSIPECEYCIDPANRNRLTLTGVIAFFSELGLDVEAARIAFNVECVGSSRSVHCIQNALQMHVYHYDFRCASANRRIWVLSCELDSSQRVSTFEELKVRLSQWRQEMREEHTLRVTLQNYSQS